MAASREPQHASKTNWYYEQRATMLVVHEVYDKQGRYVQTDQFTIPWHLIQTSLRRVKPKPRKRS